MKKAVLLLSLLSCFSVQADELSLDLPLKAYHWDREAVRKYNLNEDNPGIGLHWTNNYYHQMVGVYKNSNRKWSSYVLLAYTPIQLGNVQIGAVAGALTGYAKPYQAAAGLYSVVKVTDKIGVNITAVPTVREINCWGFASFQLNFSL